jgi:hypothetical protein
LRGQGCFLKAVSAIATRRGVKLRKTMNVSTLACFSKLVFVKMAR